MRKTIQTLALFGSMSTLFCCALPALFVAVGAGATLAGIVSDVPQLVWLSQHKIALFTFAACMLTLSGYTQWKNRAAPCPTDPDKAQACSHVKRISRGVFWFSLAMYGVGFFFAFIAPHFV